MLERQHEIHNDVGLHARPAAVFTKRAADFEATVTAMKGERTANAKSLLSLLQLDIQPGDAFTLRAEGSDAEAALDALGELIATWSEESAGAASAEDASVAAPASAAVTAASPQGEQPAPDPAPVEPALPGDAARLLGLWGDALAGLTGDRLAEAVRRSEGRTLLAEAVAPAPPLLGDVSNVELVAAMGADLVCLNLYEPGARQPLPGLEALDPAPDTLGGLARLLGRPVGCNLEPDVAAVPEPLRASTANVAALADEAASFVVVTANPGRGVRRADLEAAVRTVRAEAPDLLCIAGKMHAAGADEEVGVDDVDALLDAGAHGVLVPLPGTVPGVGEETARELSRRAHARSALSMGTIGTSQEGADEATIRDLALTAKRVGVDVHHLGDAGLGGIAVPANIYTYSEVVRGVRHTWRRMAHGLRVRWQASEEKDA